MRPDPDDPASVVSAAVEQMASVVIVYQGPEHVFTVINEAGRRLFGDRPLIGRTYREAVPDSAGQRIAEYLDQAYTSGEPVSGHEWRILLDHPDGGVKEVFLNFTASPIRDADGTVCGVVSNAFDVTAQVLARDTARADAGAAEQRYRAARNVVTALQGSLLPELLPVLPGVRLAAHYLVAADDQAAGGDWFDAIPLPDGRLALTVGDVVGHGARASAVMGQLRAALTMLLLDGRGVVDALARLDGYVARVPSAAATTVGLVVLDPGTGELTYACRGHPPPLVLGSDGRGRYLAGARGVPLGTAGPVTEERARLAPGELLLLYTDGLVERADRNLADGLEQLRVYAGDALVHASSAAMAEPAVDRVCRFALERMTRDGHHDDVSLIAAQWTGRPPGVLRIDAPARIDSVPGLRTRLAAWVREVGADEEDVQYIQLAVVEAVTNAVEHAYPDGVSGRYLVEGHLDERGRAVLSVSDRGRWRPPPVEPDNRGRGLMMVRGSMDSCEIDGTGAGTTLTMTRRLRQRTVVGSSRTISSGARRREVPFGTRIEQSERPRLVVSGPVDPTTVDEFRRRLREAGRGGSLPLEVDLTGVVLLASAGVQVLHALAEQMAGDGRELRLTAAPGSAAHHVLRLTGPAPAEPEPTEPEPADAQPAGARPAGVEPAG